MADHHTAHGLARGLSTINLMKKVLIILGSVLAAAAIILATAMTSTQQNQNANKYAQCVINAGLDYPSGQDAATDTYRHDLEQQCKTRYGK